MRVNMFIKSQFSNEDINPSSVAGNVEGGSIDSLDEVKLAEEDVENYAETQLDPVLAATGLGEDVVEIQEHNLKMINGETNDSVEGGFDQAPTEEAGAEIIRNQMIAEQTAMENIAGLLGISGNMKRMATESLYAKLEVNATPFKASEIHMESRVPGQSEFQVAKQLYTSHCEGIGETVKRLGRVAWNGVKEFCKKVIEFLKSLVKSKPTFKDKFKAYVDKATDIISEQEKYELSPDFADKQKGHEPSKEAVVLITANPLMIMGHYLNALNRLVTLDYSKDAEAAGVRVLEAMRDLYDAQIDAQYRGTFASARHLGEDLAEKVFHMEKNLGKIWFDFNNVMEVAKQVQYIANPIIDNLDKFSSLVVIGIGNLEKGLKALEKDGEAGKEIRDNFKDLLKAIKFLAQYPKTCAGACELGLSGIKKK